MGKLSGYVLSWLEDCGYALGYDWDNLPHLSEFDEVRTKQIYRREYGRLNKDDETRRDS